MKHESNIKFFKFAIIADNKMVGGIDLNKPDFERHTVQCDYAISSSHWGRGIVTKAIDLAVSYAFQVLDMHIVISACLERNIASSRVLEKNGFVETRKFIYNSDKFKDEPAHFFRLTRKEWKKSNFEQVAPAGPGGLSTF